MKADMPNSMLAAPIAALAMALHSATVVATPICRWVDAHGRTQMAEVVPDEYKKTATCGDSQRYELRPEQRLAAERQEAERESKARKLAAGETAARAASAPPAAAPVRRLAAKRPAEAVTESTDCPTWWRLYDESVACFGSYRTTRGAIKVEAFDKCNVIASPEARCGPRRD